MARPFPDLLQHELSELQQRLLDSYADDLAQYQAESPDGFCPPPRAVSSASYVADDGWSMKMDVPDENHFAKRPLATASPAFTPIDSEAHVMAGALPATVPQEQNSCRASSQSSSVDTDESAPHHNHKGRLGMETSSQRISVGMRSENSRNSQLQSQRMRSDNSRNSQSQSQQARYFREMNRMSGEGHSWHSSFRVSYKEDSNDVYTGDQLTDQSILQKLVAPPSSKLRLAWDVTGLLFVGYDGFMIPLLHAFFHEATPGATLATMSWLSTAFWTADIPASFLVGYHAGGLIEMRLPMIARRYMRTWLVPDSLIVSLDWLFIVLSLAGMSGNESSAGIARVGRTVRVFRMLRIVRLLRLPKLFKKVRELYQGLHSELLKVLFQVSSALCGIIVVSHFLACFWYSMAVCNWGGVVFCDSSGPSWVQVVSRDQDDVPYLYATSLHWAAAQFTPADMEIVPQSIRERFFAVATIWFGFIMFSCFVSSITTNMTQLRSINNEQYVQEDTLKSFLMERKVSIALGKCIMDFFKETQREAHKLREEDIKVMATLPARLHYKLHVEMYMPIFMVHPFFEYGRYVHMPSICQLCHVATAELPLLTGQDLFIEGEEAGGAYCTTDGQMVYHSRDHQTQVAMKDWVAEAALWCKWRHQGHCTATTLSQVVKLDTREFQMIFCAAEVETTIARYASNYASSYLSHLKSLKSRNTSEGAVRADLCDDLAVLRDFAKDACKVVTGPAKSEGKGLKRLASGLGLT